MYKTPCSLRAIAAELSWSIDTERAGVPLRIGGGSVVLEQHGGEVPVRLKPDMVRVPYGTEVMRITPSDYAVTLVPTTTQPPGPE